MIIGQLALLAAAMFAGAALFVHVAEQPARLRLDDAAMRIEWRRSYQGAAKLQASLALIGGLLALLAYLLTPDWRWLMAALLLLANWPYTLLVMRPVNAALASDQTAGSETRALVERWGRLHAVRTALGFASAVLLVWAMN